jgi:hypothetical protein
MSSGRVTNPGPYLHSDMRTMLRSIGIPVTDDGMALARKRRLEAAARHTPEQRAAWRDMVGPAAAGHGPAGRRPVRVVLDTSAILAFSRGSIPVGDTAAEVDDDGSLIGLPIACLVEARWRLADAGRLSLLVHHRATELIAAPGDWSALAAALDVAGRQDAASALLAAVLWGCDVLTAHPRRYSALAGGCPVIPIPR